MFASYFYCSTGNRITHQHSPRLSRGFTDADHRHLNLSGVKAERIILGYMEYSRLPGDGVYISNSLKTGAIWSLYLFAAPKYALLLYARNLDDTGRVEQIAPLVNQGFGNRIRVSYNCLTVGLMAVKGGPGIVHILNKIVPLVRTKWLSEEQIHPITVDNPAQVCYESNGASQRQDCYHVQRQRNGVVLAMRNTSKVMKVF